MAKPLVVGVGEILWDLLPGGKQLGGAPANFAYHAGVLGAAASVFSRVGNDDAGREIFEQLDGLGLDRSHVGVDPAYPTGRVDVRVDSVGVPAYVIHAPAAWDFLDADDAALNLASRADAICFGTLAQRSRVSCEAIRRFLAATPPTCLRVFDINLRQSYYDRDVIHHTLLRSDVLKLNDDEIGTVVQRLDLTVDGDDDSDEVFAIDAILKKCPLRLVALTRGTGGSVLCTKAGEWSDYPGFPVGQVADTVGAGDAFTAALAMGLLAGHDLGRTNAFANRLAAFVCSRPGATPAIPPELLAEWRSA